MPELDHGRNQQGIDRDRAVGQDLGGRRRGRVPLNGSPRWLEVWGRSETVNPGVTRRLEGGHDLIEPNHAAKLFVEYPSAPRMIGPRRIPDPEGVCQGCHFSVIMLMQRAGDTGSYADRREERRYRIIPIPYLVGPLDIAFQGRLEPIADHACHPINIFICCNMWDAKPSVASQGIAEVDAIFQAHPGTPEIWPVRRNARIDHRISKAIHDRGNAVGMRAPFDGRSIAPADPSKFGPRLGELPILESDRTREVGEAGQILGTESTRHAGRLHADGSHRIGRIGPRDRADDAGIRRPGDQDLARLQATRLRHRRVPSEGDRAVAVPSAVIQPTRVVPIEVQIGSREGGLPAREDRIAVNSQGRRLIGQIPRTGTGPGLTQGIDENPRLSGIPRRADVNPEFHGNPQ